MTEVGDALYTGTVVHARARPVRHHFRYRVFAVLFDCNRLASLGQRLRLFSYNRFNLFSLYDGDHGDGTPLPDYLARIAREAGEGDRVRRFVMLCYPRILGYAFNPLTVYFGLDDEDRVRLTVYEVNNTFGQRKTYVVPADPRPDGLIVQHCDKELHVSPFNRVEGGYSFHVTEPADDLTVGVALKDAGGPVLRAHFRARREALTDRALLKALARMGWMTVTVTFAIHHQALKLWLKGLKLFACPPAPGEPVTYVEKADAEIRNHG